MTDRYQVDGSQGTWQPGSADRVLANKLGIVDPDEMAEAELHLLGLLYEQVLVEELPDRSITAADLVSWHRQWLGNLYEFAGRLRSVNVSKDGFLFANAALVPALLDSFERDCLQRHTPCVAADTATLARSLAICHVELILIHPFREGNGRLARLLADVMAVQASRQPLDYSAWDANKASYFAAIQAGQGGDYQPMERLVAMALGA